MKNTKFRVWFYDGEDIKNGEMMYNGFITFDNKEINVEGDVMDYPNECIKLMQYTGFKDKNGKEIYFDSDIVTNNKITTIVEWDNWQLLDEIQNGIGDWKIIGNLYESPELINDV